MGAERLRDPPSADLDLVRGLRGEVADRVDDEALEGGRVGCRRLVVAVGERALLEDPDGEVLLERVGQLLRGDLGTSLLSNTSVAGMIGDRLGPTLNIALMTIVISVALAVPMGVIAAWRHRSWVDFLVMSFSVLGFSVPVFVIGYILIQIFAIDLKWVPVQGYKSPTDGIGPFFSRAILPSLTLATIYIALIARMTRASMLEVLGEDYIRTARAKGVRENVVLFRHALRNAAVPILTIIGTGFALLISGVVVTESVFNIPGIGRLTVDAILARDYPVIQAMILLTAGIYVTVNLLIDISYSFFDPRIRY